MSATPGPASEAIDFATQILPRELFRYTGLGSGCTAHRQSYGRGW
jgi:hypothetical protein